MKIRNGFVSNSSSSSYIVQLRGISMDDFYRELQSEYGWHIFDVNSILKDVRKNKGRVKKYIEEHSQRELDNENPKVTILDEHFSKMYRERLEKLEEVETQLKEANYTEVIDIVLEYYGITVTEVEGGIDMEYFTCMHNSFTEGMSEVLQEIVMYFLFDTSHTIKCTRDGDE